MVKREKVTDAQGRRWVSGSLSAEEYFAAARRSAHEQARRTVAARLAGAARPTRSAAAER